MYRYAGDVFKPEKYTGDSDVSPMGEIFKRSYDMLQDKTPGIPLDPALLDYTVPEMQRAPYYPGQDLMRDRHIKLNPGSGITQLTEDIIFKL